MTKAFLNLLIMYSKCREMESDNESVYLWFASQPPATPGMGQAKARSPEFNPRLCAGALTELLELLSAVSHGARQQEAIIRNGARTPINHSDMEYGHPSSKATSSPWTQTPTPMSAIF